MKLNDAIIKDLFLTLKNSRVRRFDYREEKAWPESEGFELILQKDMAYELGAGGKEAVNFTCVTEDSSLMRKFCKRTSEKKRTDSGATAEESGFKDQILLFGKDLPAITSASNYARITLLLVKAEEETETDSQKLFQTLQELDFVKYNVHPEGYMVRTSNQNHREQVRIGKEALKKGMTFEAIGDSFIRKYRQNEKVLQVCVIFITDENMDYEAFYREAKQAADIRNSLSLIKKGLPTECSICEIKEICNEVEGLRELHFGKQEKKRAGVRI
ncbi:MAG: hypothetical protein MJ116_06540 [Lachnospiraceae bacterium]|nr:hypothetical protein [Lachnospiraceae bacterium]